MTAFFSTVFPLTEISGVIMDSRNLGLNIIIEESDLDSGYITFSGEKYKIDLFKSYLNGETFI